MAPRPTVIAAARVAATSGVRPRSAKVGRSLRAGHVDVGRAPEALGHDRGQGCRRLVGRHAADIDARDADPGVGLAIVDALIGGPGSGQDGRHRGREEGQSDDQGEHDLDGERQVALGDGLEADLFRMGDGQQSVSPARLGACLLPCHRAVETRTVVPPGSAMLGPERPDCKTQSVMVSDRPQWDLSGARFVRRQGRPVAWLS